MKEIKRAIQASAVAAGIGGVLLLSACSSYEKGSGQPAGPQSPTGSTSQKAAAQDGQAADPTGLTAQLVATQSSVGTILADGSGRSLYRFDEDTAAPSASNCADTCASKWPPVTVQRGSAVEVQGVSRSDVGSVQRSDGTWQVTVGGWPVYRYALDQNAGDVKGQGVGGTWFAVTPTGKKAGDSNTGDSGQGDSSTGDSGQDGDSGDGSDDGGYGSGDQSGDDSGGYGGSGY